MNRRELIHNILLGGTTLIVAPSFLQSCSKDPDTDPGTGGNNNNPPPVGGTKITIDLTNSNFSALAAVGGSIVTQSVLVANTGSNIFIAIDSVCTHNGCTVEYKHDSSNIQCPCHGSVFNKSGSVITGPAAVALKTYPITKVGDILTITLS